MGDDEKPLCRDIAMEFGRTPGTIDRQWRNIKDILNEKNNVVFLLFLFFFTLV